MSMNPLGPIAMAAFLLVLLAQNGSGQTTQTTFEFHNSVWVNLHHTLYNQASALKEGRQPDLAALTSAEAATWNQGLEYYSRGLINHSLLERSMTGINSALVASGNSAGIATSPLISPELTRVLEVTAPIYRAHWWVDHQKKNEEWIAAATPLVAMYEAALKPALARAFDTPWPKERVHVELSYYTTGNSAYTSLRPTLVTVSSWSQRNVGVAAVETLFHEAGHALVEKALNQIANEAKRRKKDLQYPDLWHALQFFTNSELIRRQIPDLEPYASKYGLWENAWPLALPVLDKDWKPFLDGKGNFRDAIRQVVADSLKP